MKPGGSWSLVVALPLLAVLACRDTKMIDPSAPRPPPKVEHAGAMQEMFESGSAAGQVALRPLLARPHLYAIGPLADLKGEILVWDGTPFVSRMEGERVAIATEPDATAPVLVWSRVAIWKDLAVPDDARELAAFEAWLPKGAREAGLDSSEPFAFQVVGAVERATIHVDALPRGTPVTREARDATKHVVALAACAIQAIGFHATDAKGIYTHHDSNVHIHLRTPIGATMGHVESFTLAPGAIVKLAWR